jgi:hypothetical protein
MAMSDQHNRRGTRVVAPFIVILTLNAVASEGLTANTPVVKTFGPKGFCLRDSADRAVLST